MNRKQVAAIVREAEAAAEARGRRAGIAEAAEYLMDIARCGEYGFHELAKSVSALADKPARALVTP